MITNLLLLLIYAHMRGWHNKLDAVINTVRKSIKDKIKRIRKRYAK